MLCTVHMHVHMRVQWRYTMLTSTKWAPPAPVPPATTPVGLDY
jgi:hypothetical protein